MTFRIVYHHLVVSEDIPKLSGEWRDKVRLAIEQRLATRPDLYGKPLRRSLKGYRKLRVGDWRVIFRIEKNIVRVLIIEHRSASLSEGRKKNVRMNKSVYCHAGNSWTREKTVGLGKTFYLNSAKSCL